MLDPAEFHRLLQSKGIEYSAGVPDSLLKQYCAYLRDHGNDTITANEGGAIALAAGYHMATGKIPLVYMQNSGFGNTVNPLASLVDPEVYSIPMLLLVGWRGEPGTADEPQHIRQGRAMEGLLGAMEIPYARLATEQDLVADQLDEAFRKMRERESPYVLLVSAGTFSEYRPEAGAVKAPYPMLREEALEAILPQLGARDVIVSTTGKASRELFELRARRGEGHSHDFLTVGSMGHASQIALGIALEQPDRDVYCLDGDGAMLMHMGSLAIIGQKGPENLKHLLINNGAHESVGGQPTAGFSVDFRRIALGCGYRKALRAETAEELKDSLSLLRESAGPSLLEVMTAPGARGDLGRPTRTPQQNKRDLMEYLRNSKT